MTVTDTSREILSASLTASINEQTQLNERRASIEADLNAVNTRLDAVNQRVEDLTADLGENTDDTEPTTP